jgi:hypothetical protein
MLERLDQEMEEEAGRVTRTVEEKKKTEPVKKKDVNISVIHLDQGKIQ